MTTSTPPAIDLQTCSASDLSNYLLEHRFENDGLATTEFLLEGTGSLPNAEAIAQQIHESADAEEDDEEEEVVQAEEATASTNNNTKQGVATLVSSISESPQSTVAVNSVGEALHSQPIEVSLTNPRGKFHVTFHKNGIHASTIKNPEPLIIPAGSVANIIVFPKPTDCVRTSSSKAAAAKSPMMLLCFHDDNQQQNQQVIFKGKSLSQICLPVPTTLEEPLQKVTKSLELDTNNNDPTEAWIQLVCHSLGIDDPEKSVFRIHNPTQPATTTTTANKKEWAFVSHQEANKSSTASGMPFVKCYYGVQDGCLFPMRQGLLFFKPPLFVPRSKLHSIACGRGNGASSRYVDMNIVTLENNNASQDDEDDEEEDGPMETNLEFTNIAREELGVLNDYIHKVLIPAMQQDQKSGTATSNGGGASASDEEDDDEDAIAVDVVDDDDEDDKKEGTRVRSKRRAAREARQQTKQHFMQKKKGASNDEENSDDDDDDDDDSEEDDASFCAAMDEDEEDDGDDEKDAVSVVDEEEEENEDETDEVGAKQGEPVGDDDEDDDDDEEAEVVEVEEVEDITESDAEETEEEEDEVESSPPPGKKRRSK